MNMNAGTPDDAQASTNGFAVTLPPLPDRAATEERIRKSVTHQITGRVAAVAGESIEIEGMTAPLGAICELTPHSGETRLARVIGFRGVHPLLAPLERL